MRLTSYVYAGRFEQFAVDVRLPEPGQTMTVRMPDGTTTEGQLVKAERVDAHRLRVTVEVADSASVTQT